MEKLRAWLKRRGFGLEVQAGAEDCVCFQSAMVSINSRLTPQSRLAALLHECGHVDVLHKRLKNRRKPVAGATLRQWGSTVNPEGMRRMRVRINVVTEEIEAWDRGEAIAKRLKIRYNKKSFDRARTRALMTYFRWTAGARQKQDQ